MLVNAIEAGELSGQAASATIARFRSYQWPGWIIARIWDLGSLLVLLAVVAAIPLIQLASLGYLLTAAANLAKRRSWAASLPGLSLAGRLGTYVLLTSLTWLPVWLVTDLAYSAQLLQPNSDMGALWRLASFLVTGAWLLYIGWAAMRGGRWWHFLWPAPLQFVRTFWKPSTWSQASERLYDLLAALHFPQLWWLGCRAAIGAILWISIPVSLMIFGQRVQDFGAAGIVGLVGALAMTAIALYLPFLQIQLAAENRFTALFRIDKVRRRFLYAPWAHAAAMLVLCAFSIPLYLLRIEATPEELVWAPALVFVLLMLPAKILLGASMGYADGRQLHRLAKRFWLHRWPARLLTLLSVLIYVGALYIAQLIAGQGALVMYFQHAFLIPAPLIR